MSNSKQGFFANLKSDLPASLVVFLVALPLCLGIALASGAPLFSGLIAGIVGGIIVTSISGSSLGVSGPAAGLAVIVYGAIETFGFEAFLFAVVVAGAFQILLSIMRAGIIGYYFPSSVIKGMLAGIGVLIFLKQIPIAFGHKTFSEFGDVSYAISPGAFTIALVSLAILILWERPFMSKVPGTNIIKGPLVAVLTGIGLNVAFQGSEAFSLKAAQLVNIPVADSLGGFFDQFSGPDWSQWKNGSIYVTAAILAVVASLETLLCVEATDKLDPEKRVTPTNRELLAQGAGNVVSGLIGGLPVTQVIVRSSANIQSGGKSRASAFIHGILLLVSVMTIPALLNLIPLASLAAILMVVGYKLAKPAVFKEMYKLGWGQLIPFLVTIIGIVLTNLLEGIALGLMVAVAQILINNFRVPFNFDPKSIKAGEPVRLSLSEDVSFLNKAGILKTLDQMPDGTHLIIDASTTRTMHPDVLEIIRDFEKNAKTRDIQLTLVGFEDESELSTSVAHLGDIVALGQPNEGKADTV